MSVLLSKIQVKKLPYPSAICNMRFVMLTEILRQKKNIVEIFSEVYLATNMPTNRKSYGVNRILVRQLVNRYIYVHIAFSTYPVYPICPITVQKFVISNKLTY